MNALDALRKAKRRLRDRYLGTAGVHGMGLDTIAGTIRVYCKPRRTREQQDLLKRLRRDAAPFGVEVIIEPPPRTR